MAAPSRIARCTQLIGKLHQSLCTRRNGCNVPLQMQVRCHGVGGTGDYDGKTTVTIINKDNNYLMIDTFSEMGFRLNNQLMVLGPIAIFPKSVLCWNVKSAEDLNEESMSLFHVLEPKLAPPSAQPVIDILVVGVGDRGNKVPTPLIQFMQKKKIYLEVLPTEQACATFNFLNSEGRCVAGAMIPPATVRVTDEDIVTTKGNTKKLFVPQFNEKTNLL